MPAIQWLLNLPRWWNIGRYTGSSGASSAAQQPGAGQAGTTQAQASASAPAQAQAAALDQHDHDTSVAPNNQDGRAETARATVEVEPE